jgi:hypothetical protein
MIKDVIIEIDGVVYTIPKEITITQYGEVMRRITMSETELEKSYDLIQVLMDIPYQILRELDPTKLVELSIYLQNTINQNDLDYIKTFTYNDVDYGGLDLTKMSFGEYIDLANYIKNEASIYINISKICSILYRPITSRKKDKFSIKEYNIEEHIEQSIVFKDLPVKYFIGSFNNLYTYIKQIKKEFVVLFGDEDEQDSYLPKEEHKDEDETNLPWYKMIMSLSNEDFTKIDYVTGRPVVECFNHLSYIRLKNEELKRQHQERQNKILN